MLQTQPLDTHVRPGSAPDQRAPLSPDETVVLLGRVRQGDDDALSALVERILPRLRRWAHGRLPRASRGMLETGDIVQAVASKAARQFARLEIAESIEFGAYLRQAVANELASQWRRADRAPINTSVGDSMEDDQLSPLEQLLGAERLQRYERALERLEPADRGAIVGRFEFAYDYDELAHFLGKSNAGAARVAVHRAVKRLTEAARRV